MTSRYLRNDWLLFYLRCHVRNNLRCHARKDWTLHLESPEEPRPRHQAFPSFSHAHDSVLPFRRFWGQPERPEIIILLKQGEVTVTDWLEQCKIKIAPEDKMTGNPGGNLTKIACYLRKEPGQTCHLSMPGIGFRLSVSHIDQTSWKKNNNNSTFSL